MKHLELKEVWLDEEERYGGGGGQHIQTRESLGKDASIPRLPTIEKDDFPQKTAAWSLHNPSLFLALVGWGEERGPQVDIYVGVLSERGRVWVRVRVVRGWFVGGVWAVCRG